MISPIRNKRPPYELPSNIIYFHDWRYVHHGSHSTGWRDKEGEWLRIWTQEEVPPLRYDPGYMPKGIRLKILPKHLRCGFGPGRDGGSNIRIGLH